MDTGKVGIGTTNPTQALDVVGTAIVGTNTVRDRNVIIATDEAVSPNPGTSTFAGQIKSPQSGHLVFDLRNNDTADSIAFRYSSVNTPTIIDTIGLIMKGNGNVGIGTQYLKLT